MKLFRDWILEKTGNSSVLPVSVFRGRNMEGFFEGSAEAVVSVEPHFGSDLIDGVVGLFQQQLSSFKT